MRIIIRISMKNKNAECSRKLVSDNLIMSQWVFGAILIFFMSIDMTYPP